MRTRTMTLLVSVLAAAAWARPALAAPPPAAEAATGNAPTALSVAPASTPDAVSTSAPVTVPRGPRLELSWPGPSLPWAVPRATVASIGPLLPLPLRPGFGLYSGPSRPLRVSGGVVMGLGLLALLGAGITGIVAAAEASRLDDQCPGKVCFEGSRGADTLQSTKDTALAADWLVGIGAPVTASGVVMMLYSAVVERNGRLVSPSPVFRASPGGGGLMFHF